MTVLEVLKQANNICWYPGSAFDFDLPSKVTSKYVKNNGIDYYEDHDLFVFTDVGLNFDYIKKLNKGEDFEYNDRYYSKITNIQKLRKLSIPFNIPGFEEYEMYKNRSWLFDVEYIGADGLESYKMKVLYVASDAFEFLDKILFKSKIQITTLLFQPGCDPVIGMMGNKIYELADKLGLRYYCGESFYNCSNKTNKNGFFLPLKKNSLCYRFMETNDKFYSVDHDIFFKDSIIVLIDDKRYLIDFGAPTSILKDDLIINGNIYNKSEPWEYRMDDLILNLNPLHFGPFYYINEYEYKLDGVIGYNILKDTGLTLIRKDYVLFKPFDLEMLELSNNRLYLGETSHGICLPTIEEVSLNDNLKANFVLDGVYSYCQVNLPNLRGNNGRFERDFNFYVNEKLKEYVQTSKAKSMNYEFEIEYMEMTGRAEKTKSFLKRLKKENNIDGILPARFIYANNLITSFDFKNRYLDLYKYY